MSSPAVAAQPESVEPAGSAPRRSRGFVRQVLGDTFCRAGARVGLVWIGFLAVLAVFAPFIANSHPYLMKMDGEWSSPLLNFLSPFDVILVAVFITSVILLLLKALPMRVRWIVWLTINGVVAIASFQFVKPPDIVVYESARELEAEGRATFVLRAPVPYSPNDRMNDRRGITRFEGPWWASPIDAETGEREWQGGHLLGQDPFKQDIAARMIHATRISLAIGFIGTGIAVTIGIVIGSLMGYFAAFVDLVGMRIVEVFEFIPSLYLLLMFVAFFPGDYPEILPGIRVQRLYMIMIIIGLVGWVGYARYVRAEFLKLRRQDFVQAAIACGLPLRSILFKHMLPNGVTPVLVGASFGVASAIIAEATLSFIGLGLIEDPSWGQLLHQATRSGSFIWWIATFPGLAIFLTVFSYNMIGEALRDAIDPHTRRLQRAGT